MNLPDFLKKKKILLFQKGKFFLINGIIMIFLAGILNSCTMDEDHSTTSGELNAQKINSVIVKEKPSMVNIYQLQWDDSFKEYDWDFIIGTSDYELEGVFIRVNKYYYNLEKLHNFRMNGSTLEVYFDLN